VNAGKSAEAMVPGEGLNWTGKPRPARNGAGDEADGWSLDSESAWQRPSAASSFVTVRNRWMRSPMSGGVGAGVKIPSLPN
jgi:hypothetical protein